MRSIALSVLAASTQAASPWPPSAKAAAAATLAKMTSDQKFTLVHGWGGDYVGDTPPITLSDGTIIPGFHYHVSKLSLSPPSPFRKPINTLTNVLFVSHSFETRIIIHSFVGRTTRCC